MFQKLITALTLGAVATSTSKEDKSPQLLGNPNTKTTDNLQPLTFKAGDLYQQPSDKYEELSTQKDSDIEKKVEQAAKEISKNMAKRIQDAKDAKLDLIRKGTLSFSGTYGTQGSKIDIYNTILKMAAVLNYMQLLPMKMVMS